MPRRWSHQRSGCARRLASGLKIWAKPERGAEPPVHSAATARHSLASHPSAKPQRNWRQSRSGTGGRAAAEPAAKPQRNRWQSCGGIGGKAVAEPVAKLRRNRWQSRGGDFLRQSGGGRFLRQGLAESCATLTSTFPRGFMVGCCLPTRRIFATGLASRCGKRFATVVAMKPSGERCRVSGCERSSIWL